MKKKLSTFKETIVYYKDRTEYGKDVYCGYLVNFPEVVLQADNIEELKQQAIPPLEMIRDMLSNIIKDKEPFELREETDQLVWIHGEREAELIKKLKRYEDLYGEL